MPKADTTDIHYLACLDVEGEKREPNIAQDDWYFDSSTRQLADDEA